MLKYTRHPYLIRLSILLLILFITLLTISGRGCSKRSKRGDTEGTGSGGSGNWTRITAPSNLNAIAVSSSQIELSWQDNSTNEDGFEIQRKIGLSGTYAQLATTTVNYYSDTNNVANGLTYFYIVRAFNLIGDNSVWSNEASVGINVPGNISAIAAGYKHTLALASNGMVWAWGNNYYGELGFTDYNDKTQPTLISSDFYYEPFDSVNRITAGGDDLGEGYFSGHSIIRKSDGTLWVWGYNTYGQLGTGNYQDLDGPFQWNTDADWSLLSAGGAHTTALKNDNRLWAWGRNNYGQLGLGDTTNRYTATAIGADSDWSSLSGGRYYTMGIKTSRTLWAWGNNPFGQLGLDDTINRWTPTQVGFDSDWIEITAGNNHTLSRKFIGTLWAWGQNYYGQLGDGTSINRKTPRQIGTDSDWSMAAVGTSHTMGIRTDGTLWIWGKNDYGQLGLGDTINRSTPVQVGIQTDWSIIKAGALYSLGLKTNGTLWAWGQNDSGQLGVADVISRNIPTQVIFDTPYPPGSLLANIVSSTQINLSWTDNSNNEEGFKIARKLGRSGTYEEIATVGINITSWSDISQTGFALGTYYYYRVRAFNNFGNSAYPEAYAAVSGNWTKITCGYEYTLAVKTMGTLWGWGRNVYGQLGLGGTPLISMPTQICSDADWTKIAAGESHTLGHKTTGTLWAWGDNSIGQLGDGTTMTKVTPYQISPDTDWSKIAAGSWWTLGIKTAGTLWAWGSNSYPGRLGLGDTIDRWTPALVGTNSDWLEITAGYSHTIGRRTFMDLPGSQAGALWAWGDNYYGQLGDGSTIYRTTPLPIGGDGDWVEIAAGYYHTLSRKSTGTLWAWGQNDYGQLGLGDSTNRNRPFQVGTDSDWAEIAAHFSFHTIGRKTSGTLWAWGRNDYGQLGLGDNGEETNRNTPTQIGTNTDWAKIAAGESHSIGLKTNGTLWAWGFNFRGQLGLGDILNRSVPTLVGE